MKSNSQGSAMIITFILGIACMMILGMTVRGLLVSVKWTSHSAQDVQDRATTMSAERPGAIE